MHFLGRARECSSVDVFYVLFACVRAKLLGKLLGTLPITFGNALDLY